LLAPKREDTVIVLGIDTALGACSAAVLDGEMVLAHEHQEMARGHAEALAPMVQRVMKQAQLGFDALQRIGVTTGPGTFTGQRVGLAFARGLTLALKRPALGVTTLAAMAEEALDRERTVWAAIVADAKRGEVYLGAVSRPKGTLTEPVLLSIADAVEQITDLAARNGASFAVGGTAAEFFVDALARSGHHARISAVRQPDARFVARLALGMSDGESPPRPLYLRAPDAKLPGQR
jgi:tRNA threonylcarbamoyl adenosine modification protein YeaZ